MAHREMMREEALLQTKGKTQEMVRASVSLAEVGGRLR